jgi:AAA15 family ATPase/GTPase
MNTQITTPTNDQELLKNLSIDELEALANSTLIPKSQNQLQELLSKNTEATLSTEETHLLDHLLAQIDYLNILKTSGLSGKV